MKEKKRGPYIGVTGFMSQEEVRKALEVIPKEPWHHLMAGVLMSSKTLAGKTNKWPGRFPKREAIANIFVDDPRALNLIHYNTDEPGTLCEQLHEATYFGGPNLDGFQLNVAWPPVAEIERFWDTCPEMFIVLQIGTEALARRPPNEVIDLLSNYTHMIDVALFDMSSGTGNFLRSREILSYLDAIPESWLMNIFQFSVGVAGGLEASTLNVLDFFYEYVISIDSEGRLRTPQPEDALNVDAMRAYLQGAFQKLELPRNP